jgi:hypothetical protein
MKQNSNILKYYFYAVVLILQRYSWHKGSIIKWLLYKLIGDVIHNKFVHFCDFMCQNEAINGKELE